MSTDSENLKEGAALAKSGQFDEAMTVFEGILQTHPDDVEALFLKGACHFKLGQNQEASECWNRVLALDPDHAKARAMLEKIPAASSWDSGSGFEPSAPAPQPSSPPPATPAKAKKKQAPEKRFDLKKIAIFLILLALVGFGADMYLNPNSYPFLQRDSAIVSEPEQAESASQAVPDPGPSTTDLQSGLSGKWFFLFEGSPSEFNFYPNGRLGVTVKRDGGVTFNLDGTYEIEGDTITFTVNTPEGPEQVKAHNAKISGPNFTFNYDDPEGPVIEAERR